MEFQDSGKVITDKVDLKDENGNQTLSGAITYHTYLYGARVKKYQETMDGVETEDGKSTIKDDLLLSSRYFEIMKERVASMDLDSPEGKITTVEALYEYSEGISLGNSIALKLVSGQRLGKPKLE